jgi:hypothetical protein
MTNLRLVARVRSQRPWFWIFSSRLDFGLGSTFRKQPKSLLCNDFFSQINNNKINKKAFLALCLLKFSARSPYV